MRLFLFLFLKLCFSFHSYAQELTKFIATEGNYSPSVYAEEVSIGYGLHPGHIDMLDQVLKKEGLALQARRGKIENLLNKVKSLPQVEKSNKQLSSSALKQLDIDKNPELINIFQWIVFTDSDYSPAIIAKGDVEVWYGISEKPFRGLFEIFMRDQGQFLIQQGKINEFIIRLKEQVAEFQQLNAELQEKRGAAASEARDLLRIGKINAARKTLEKHYFF